MGIRTRSIVVSNKAVMLAEMKEQFRNYQEKTDKSINGLRIEIQETRRLMLNETRSMMARLEEMKQQ